MLKMLGAVMIVSSCSLIGISINRKLCDRIRVLQEWISVLQEIKAEIVFRATPITEIFEQFAGKQNHFTSHYFHVICENLRVFGIQTAAEQAIVELKRLSLTEDDIYELQRVFNAIGRYDAVTQAEALTRSISALELQLTDAKFQQSQKGRLYQAVGLSCGVALALLAV